MQLIKYHFLNISAMLLFAYSSAQTAITLVSHQLPQPEQVTSAGGRHAVESRKTHKAVNIQSIVESGFFKQAEDDDSSPEIGSAPADLSELELIGTVTGPPVIARAMIRKQGERNPVIYALYRYRRDLTNEVYGYRLVAIRERKVYLKKDDEIYNLDLFDKKKRSAAGSSSSGSGRTIKKTLSRSFIQQKVLNDMDRALQGLRAGPYMKNGQVEGYRLVQVRPYNILYKLGARSGDIIRRINGKSIDSTQKMLKMWETLKEESRMTIDLERRGKPMTFELNITE
jgi:general secretion pathway protein C